MAAEEGKAPADAPKVGEEETTTTDAGATDAAATAADGVVTESKDSDADADAANEAGEGGEASSGDAGDGGAASATAGGDDASQLPPHPGLERNKSFLDNLMEEPAHATSTLPMFMEADDDSDASSIDFNFMDAEEAGIDRRKLKLDRFDFDLSEFNAKVSETPFQKRRDKLFFTLGVINICTIAYAAGGHPWFLPWYYTIKFPALIGLRFILYKQKHWHYFLLDFCYYANIILLTYIWFMNHSHEMFMIVYAMCNGPLAWAVVVFRNSLVFHSLDKITSAFIHVTPVTIVFAIRWHSSTMEFPTVGVCTEYSACANPMTWLLLVPGLLFIAHQVLYWFLLKVIFRIPSDPAYLTTFRYLTANKKSPLTKAVNVFGPKFAPLLFSVLYSIFAYISMVPAFLLYQSFLANFIFVVFIVCMLIWNGANFYVEVFSRGYGNKKKAAKAVDEKENHKAKIASALLG